MTEQRILVVGPSWVGDMVMAQSLFMSLKADRPDDTIDVVAPAWSIPVIERMPQVREGIALAVGHGEFGLAKRRQLGRQLQQRGYDRAIVLPRSMKAALLPWFAKVPRRTGFRGEMRFGLINDIRRFDKSRLDQTVKRFVALGLERDGVPQTLPPPALSVSSENQRAVLRRLDLNTDRPLVALLPGAEYGPAKCWPLSHFRALAKQLEAAGFTVWVMGSDKDRPAAGEIVLHGDSRNLCGQTSLAEAIDLLACCKHAVSNDSGLMHVAAALGVHVHALYGSSDPGFTPPLTEQRTIHYLGLDCSPCFKRECPLTHLNCLKHIAPQIVFDGIKSIDGEK